MLHSGGHYCREVVYPNIQVYYSNITSWEVARELNSIHFGESKLILVLLVIRVELRVELSEEVNQSFPLHSHHQKRQAWIWRLNFLIWI
jgi:hypothetical protein